MEKYTNLASILLLLLLAMAAATLVDGQITRVGFYSRSCPRAESIIRSTVRRHFKSNRAIAPGLLRLINHDCFVQGCDASVLIDGPNTEKAAPANRRLVGIEVIDDAKTQLEVVCPRTVSCADILALASRDAVKLADGPSWQVPTGRLDGRISIASEAFDLPSFRDSIDVQKRKFSDLGLNTQDLVTLVGGHTIGTTACQFFRYRLFNFTTNRLFNFTTTGNGADPTINPAFLPQLQALCPQNGDGSRRVALDTGSENNFDTSFFTNLRNGRGVLESDQLLWTNASTNALVQRFLGNRGSRNFNAEFGRAMVRMTNIGLKRANEGEIRRVCNAIN